MRSTPQWPRTPLASLFDVESHRRDVRPRVESRSIGIFGAQIDLENRLDGSEARLARVAAIGYAPVNFGRGRIGSRLDAAMTLFDGGFANQFFCRGRTEVVRNFSFQGWLV